MSKSTDLSNIINTSDTTRHDYKEADALQALLRAAYAGLEDSDKRFMQHDDHAQFTINIYGRSIAFLFGAAQFEALLAFIEHLAGENMHAVDLDALTVDGIL